MKCCLLAANSGVWYDLAMRVGAGEEKSVSRMSTEGDIGGSHETTRISIGRVEAKIEGDKSETRIIGNSLNII